MGELCEDDTFSSFLKEATLAEFLEISQGHRLDIICCHPNPRVPQGLCDRTVWVPVWLENRLEFYKTCYLNYWIVWRSLSAALSKTGFLGLVFFRVRTLRKCTIIQPLSAIRTSLRVDLVIWSKLAVGKTLWLNVLKKWAKFYEKTSLGSTWFDSRESWDCYGLWI